MTKVNITGQGNTSDYDAAMSTAKSLLNSVAEAINDSNPLSIETGILFAQTEIALAQAEQLKRIADMMEDDRQTAKAERDARAFVANAKYGR